ncbi:MAG: hypothetical protein DMG55_09625 [Acidobacteria bacterium]|nr:MAG: hypothetical protein DMG55_09625 [Acidobacteriota bacterium]
MLGIIGFIFLLLSCAWAAIAGLAFAEGAPHAFKGDIRIGLVFWLIALALLLGAITLLRGSIRRLRSLDQIPMSERNPR